MRREKKLYSTNTSGQNYVYCRNDCGARITFSDNAISKNGRKIPLQENGLPHNCPNSYFNKKRQELRENNNRFIKETANSGPPSLIDSEGRYSDSCPKEEQHSATGLNKITPEQQLYLDTICPFFLIVEIFSEVQKIRRHIIQEGNEKDD